MMGRQLDWQADALCAQTDPDLFMPDRGGSTVAAKKVCGECPVRAACLDYAIVTGQPEGIWGGLSADERRRIRQAAA